MNKLFIDTATKALILVLESNGQITNHVFDLTNNDHSERLMSEIEGLFNDSSLTINDIDAFYVSEGPGSYTGVRIGVTVAKMFAYTLQKPLYSISSLSVIASPYMKQATTIIPIIDARRNNVFASIYQVENEQLQLVSDERLYSFNELISIIKERSFEDVLFVGTDTANFKAALEQEGLTYTSQLQKEFIPSVVFSNLSFEVVNDIHGFSPNYRRVTEAERNLQTNE